MPQEQLWWILGKIVEIRTMPGYLWQINSSQEFAGGMPLGFSPDRTFINSLDGIEPVECADAAGWEEGLSDHRICNLYLSIWCNEMKWFGLNGNCKVQAREDLGKELMMMNLWFKKPQARHWVTNWRWLSGHLVLALEKMKEVLCSWEKLSTPTPCQEPLKISNTPGCLAWNEWLMMFEISWAVLKDTEMKN